MASLDRPRVRALLVEGAVIVGSILLAFAIDAWWNSRGEERQAEALVNALAEDFRSAEGRFESARFAYATVYSSTEELLTLADSDSVPRSLWPRVDSLVSNLFYSMNTFEPPMGAVETILSSGRLDLFSNEELLGELTRWTSTLADLKASEAQGSDHFFGRVYPLVAAALELRDLDKAAPWEMPWGQAQTDAALLLRDGEFRDVVYMHYVLYHNITEKIADVSAAIARVSEISDDLET
jgi:hypothetical protein